ncbi:hypothetical protein D3C87_1538010 [compost metagenome]
MQAGAQTDFRQYINPDAAIFALTVDERDGRDILVDGHTDARVPVEPALFGRAQLQRLRARHGHPARAPAAQDVHLFIGRYRRQCLVDDAQQCRVVAGDGKGEATGFQRRKIRQLHVVQVVFADQVMGADRIPQIDIGLTESHRPHGPQSRREQFDLRLGISLLHIVFRQVVIQHRQALAGQLRVQRLRRIRAGHQYRLVDRIGAGHQ